MMINRLFIFIFFLPQICISQTLTGLVIDKLTQQPVETAAVYFDNTTIGTTTNENGEFSITYTDVIQSTLVISYLGYEKVLISDYRSQNSITVELIEANNVLDEVHIDYDDGLTRRQKLRLFRKEFLGASKFGKSCKILNEDDLILRYDKVNKALYASSKVALEIENKALQYKIAYDLIDFEINFRYANLKTMKFTIKSVAYFGTSFYKELKMTKTPKVIKNRNHAYEGSIQHFMRSLYNKSLEKEGYWIFHNKFRVDEWAYIKVETIAESENKTVTVKDKISILFNNDLQSELHLKTDKFFIDVYGNYAPINGIYFSGVMGSQRVGDNLPLNYRLVEKEK